MSEAALLTDEQLYEVIAFDPLGDAMDRTGFHHRHPIFGDAVVASSLAGFASKNAILDHEMKARGDTHMSATREEVLAALEAEGFVMVFEQPFDPASSPGSSGKIETQYIFAHADGLLVHFETYAAERLNSGALYLNFRPAAESEWPIAMCGSGQRMRDGIFHMSFDIRGGLRLRINWLRANGEIISPWIHRPLLWLVNYSERNVSDFKALTQSRIDTLPEWVRTFVGEDLL